MAKAKKEYIYAVGRRRTAHARVRLYKGEMESTVNDTVIGKFFTTPIMRSQWQKPFVLTDTLGKYYLTAKVRGGGQQSQLEAVIHGVARALASISTENRVAVKKAGLLTRDPRTRERRKVGTGGRARRKKQSPKR